MERNPVARPVAACVAAGLFVIAATVFWRRLEVGSLKDLPAGEAAVYTAAFAAGAVVTARSLSGELDSGERRVAGVVSLIATLLFVSGLTTVPVSVLVCLVAGAAGAAVVLAPNHRATRESSVSHPVFEPAAEEAEADPAEAAGISDEEEEPALTIVRSIRDGRQVLSGRIRFEFPAGESVHTLHVPLWPPLAAEPAVRCTLEEIEGRVRVPLAKSYGLRIEVRIPEPVDEPLEGIVSFTAECPAAAAAA